MRSGPRGKRDIGGVGFDIGSGCFGCVTFFFACVLRGINDVVVTTFAGGGVSVSIGSTTTWPLVSTLDT